jgi:hypothetical protein
MEIKAIFDIPNKSINIQHHITYKNTSQDTLNTIYLNDWNNSYSTKTTPLAKRFAEEYNNKFHFAKNEERGYTIITSIANENNVALQYSNLIEHPDVIKVDLAKPLLPSESYNISLYYTLVIPNDNFTSNGIDENKNFNLKYWYITPAIYNGNWNYYSNKNIDDLFIPKSDIQLEIVYPRNYVLISELNLVNTTQNTNTQTTLLVGKNRVNTELIVTKFSDYKFVQTDNFMISSNLEDDGINPQEKAMITDKITRFVTTNLGDYPHEKILISETEYKKDPLYGLNQLPDFLRPFPDNFQYELKLLKLTLKKYLDNTLLSNPRKDYWLNDGLQIYYLMKYVEEFYPDTKLLGALANVWGIRSFHAADLI